MCADGSVKADQPDLHGWSGYFRYGNSARQFFLPPPHRTVHAVLHDFVDRHKQPAPVGDLTDTVAGALHRLP